MVVALDGSRAVGYHSASQIARVLTQDWVGRELPCLSCARPDLTPTAENTRSRDFLCERCGEPYELKSTARRFGGSVPDGDYRTMLDTVLHGRTPNLLLLQFDPRVLAVRRLTAVHRTLFTPASILPRRAPLAPTARRAGWWGCSIDLRNLPRDAFVPIVERGAPVGFDSVVRRWHRFTFLVDLQVESRGWISDVLGCIDRLPAREPFHLSQVYAFEPELARRHPSNRRLAEKIRQQLQVLDRRGILRRVRPGWYVRVGPGP